MKISILTLFPEVFSAYFASSVPGRALEKGLFELELVNIRDNSTDKHHRVDDAPFGGSAGMLMGPQPLFDCIEDVKRRHEPGTPVIYLSPCGRVWNNVRARQLASSGTGLILLCGHYEGIDQRVIYTLVDEEISIGDYVLTGGELPAMVLVDTLIRFIPGVVGASDVHLEESFEGGLLEYPQYTRPADFRGMKVPEVLLTGNHAWLAAWRREQSLLKTQRLRPDLLEKAPLTEKERLWLKDQEKER